jgi:transposase
VRGDDQQQAAMWSYISPEKRVPMDHPLRPIRAMVNDILQEMSRRFATLYAPVGRPSIPPEQQLRALLLQVLYSIRSERLLMEQLDYNLLFRWFVGLEIDAPVWSATTFSKNRERLLDGDIAGKFFARVLEKARGAQLLSDEHFTVDGTLIEAWAGHKSFKPKETQKKVPPPDDPGNPTVDFSGQKRTNATHASTTDPEARLYRKSNGTESKLCYAGHVLMDNRHGLAVGAQLTQATSKSEREAALKMMAQLPGSRRLTLGADKAYDVRAFVGRLRAMVVTPHIAAKNASYSRIDARTTRHAGYAASQKKRKRVEEIFGWTKTIGTLRKTRHRGLRRVGWVFTFTLAVYNLVRIRNLTWSSA